jgi:hypothetical protein
MVLTWVEWSTGSTIGVTYFVHHKSHRLAFDRIQSTVIKIRRLAISAGPDSPDI